MTGRSLPMVVILLLGAAGCDRIALLPPLVPGLRLADVAAEARGWAEAEMATLGEVSRYVLGDAGRARLSLGSSKVVADSSGGATFTVECPEERSVPTDGAVLTMAWALADSGAEMHVESATRWVDERCDGRDSFDVDVDDLPPGTRVTASAVTYVRPPSRLETPIITLPSAAELRVAVGVRELGAAAGATIGVAIRARDSRGRTRLVAMRRLRRVDVAASGGWVDWRVPLGPLRARLGPEVRFVFEQQSVADERGAARVLWGDPTIWGRRSARPAPERRNVLLVSLDTLRADHLGHLGYPENLTPNLDRLAAEGATFTEVVSQANWTLPAHASMLTGTYACTHQAMPWVQGRATTGFPAGMSPLAELLRRAGYSTGAFTENAWVSAGTFQRGFGVFAADGRTTARGPAGLIEDTVDEAVAFIGAHRRQRFFAFVHTYQVHAPYEPPPSFRALAERSDVPVPRGSLPPSAERRAHAAAYAAEVGYTDLVVGRLLRRLDALGLRDDTIVVVTSDHGEAFGEHGVALHGTGFHREQVQVPLIVRVPGRVAAGRRVDGLVGLVDVVPTVLSLLDLPIPPWMQGLDLSGALDPGEAKPVPGGRVLPIEGFGGQRALRGPRWTLVGKRFRDLARDPLEQRSQRPAPRLRQRARRTVATKCRKSAALLRNAAPARPRSGGQSAPLTEKLRALGYVE